MSYRAAVALQAAIFTQLRGSEILKTLIGDQIFDAPPRGELPDIYVLLGEERVLDRSTKTSDAKIHEFTIAIVSTALGFSSVKDVAEKICEIFEKRNMPLAVGTLVDLSFHSAKAVRGSRNKRRQIDLVFRAYIDLS